MNKITLLVVAMFITVSGYCQRRQFSVEGGYGLGISGKPMNTQFGHFEGGVRYMWNESWGVKLDAGFDKYRYDKTSTLETGTNYTRISVQAVYNLGRFLDWAEYVDNLNILAHGGVGYSQIKPINMPVGDQTDSMANVVLGLTPQLYLGERVSLYADWTYVMNYSQHRDYDGSFHELKSDDKAKKFIGGTSTISVGIIFYLGRYGSDNDWR